MSGYATSPPPPQKQPQRLYPPSSYPSAGSPPAASPPGAGYGQPPAKRARLSPPAGSPNGYGSYGGQISGAYGNPYATGHSPPVQSPYSPFTQSPQQQQSFNTPQAYHPYPNHNAPWQSQPSTPGAVQQRPSLNHAHTSPVPRGQGGQNQTSGQLMPPPPRPNKEDKDEKVGPDDIGDSLFGSGINLKEEESYLQSAYNNRQVESFQSTQQSTSFGSSTISPSNSFSLLTQGTSFRSQGEQGGQNGAFAGTLGSSLSEEDVQKEVDRKREQASRAKAEREQFHLHNQFLLGNVLRRKLDAIAKENGVRLDVQGLYMKQPTPQTHVMVDAQGSKGIVSAGVEASSKKDAESVVDQGAAFGDLIALISLSAGERLRCMMDDTHALARARRYGDHGLVPPDFADIAVGPGEQVQETVVPENVTGTQWTRVEERDDGETLKPQQTVSYQGRLTGALRELLDRDQKAERARAKKREARKRTQSDVNGTTTAADSAAEGSGENTPAEVTPGPAEMAPKISKKEAAKQAKEAGKAVEQINHTNTNQTAAMMAMGGRTKKYSWMTGGSSTPITNRFAKPASGTTTPTPKVEKRLANGLTAPEKEMRGPQWGDFSETTGVDMRDLVVVLERDSKEKLALEKVLLRLGQALPTTEDAPKSAPA